MRAHVAARPRLAAVCWVMMPVLEEKYSPALSPGAMARAYFFARVGFGVNLALHGWSRVPKLSEFVAKTEKEFAGTFLPTVLVQLSCYAIVAVESVAGPLIILGLASRFALAADALLLWVLIFGTCLVQNWNAAGDQLIYLAFCGGLYAFSSYNRYSLDYRRRARAVPPL